jgi:hypothetical protein
MTKEKIVVRIKKKAHREKEDRERKKESKRKEEKAGTGRKRQGQGKKKKTRREMKRERQGKKEKGGGKREVVRERIRELNITINLHGIYTAPCAMIPMRGTHTTWATGRIALKVEPVPVPGTGRAYLGPLNGPRRQPSAILGPKYARATPGPKTGETPNTIPPTAQAMRLPQIKITTHGAAQTQRRLVILFT